MKGDDLIKGMSEGDIQMAKIHIECGRLISELKSVKATMYLNFKEDNLSGNPGIFPENSDLDKMDASKMFIKIAQKMYQKK